MLRLSRLVLLAFALFACSRGSTPNETPSLPVSGAASALVPHDASRVAAEGAAPSGTTSGAEVMRDIAFSWAFWTRDGALVGASKTDLWKLDAACATPRRVPRAIDAIVARNESDRFVVEHGGAFELWDAREMRAVGAVEHPARGRGGAVSKDGSRFALGGCKEIAPDPKLMTNCGELYDGATGKHVGGFVGKHDFEALELTDDGRYLVARSGTRGLSVFDAATGKPIVTRPRWERTQDVHAWNRPDVAEVFGSELVISHGDTVEHVDLATGKTLGKLVMPGRTLAVFGPKTKRVAVFAGEAARAQIWDVATHTVVRTFALAKHVAAGANCRHCAVEIDEVDEDRVWLTSAYTDDRLVMQIGSGDVKPAGAHVLRSLSIPSATHRVEESYDSKTRVTVCALDRRDRDAPSAPLPVEFCNRTYGPSHRAEEAWPYPGFDPSGRFLASIYKSELRVWSIDRSETVCAPGRGTRSGE